MNLLSVPWLGLLLQVHPQPRDGPWACGQDDPSSATQGDGARVPVGVPEHLCHDGEWGGGLGAGHQRLSFSLFPLWPPGVISLLPLPLSWEPGKEAEENSREAFLTKSF